MVTRININQPFFPRPMQQHQSASVYGFSGFRKGRSGVKGGVQEFSAPAASFIDIPVQSNFPNANLLQIDYRVTGIIGGDTAILLRLDQGGGVAEAGYHWCTFGQASANATPTTPILDTSAEIGEGNCRITLPNTDVSDGDASISGTIWIVRPRSTTRAKMIIWQATHTNASGTASGLFSSSGGGSLHAENGAIDVVRLILGDALGATAADWAATVTQFNEA